jgi:hypothetical protein
MKFLSITLITALFVIGAVLVGVPVYKAWATTTSNCFRSHEALWIEQELHQYYPCGWIFYATHSGNGDDNASCNCDHSRPSSVSLEIWDQYGDNWVLSQECSSVTLQPCSGSYEREYCAVAHIPSGMWTYRFVCSNGESTSLQLFDTTISICQEAEWETADCQP